MSEDIGSFIPSAVASKQLMCEIIRKIKKVLFFFFVKEFRGRQSSTSTCSSTLFQLPESSGLSGSTSSEPLPAANPSAPAGTQQTGTA